MMKELVLIAITFLLLILFPFSSFAATLPYDSSNPFIWNNDVNNDVYALEYVMVLASLGRIKLIGIASAPQPYGGGEDVQHIVDIARNSGFRNIPDAKHIGEASKMNGLARPGSRNINDTVPINSDASQMIKSQVLTVGTVSKPVVIGTGGPLTTVASAYLLALGEGRGAEFAKKAVLYSVLEQVGLPNYNLPQDVWAGYICLQRLTMVWVAQAYIGPTYFSNMTPDIGDVVARLPDTELGIYMKAKRAVLIAQGPPYSYWARYDGDSPAIVAFMNPSQGTIKKISFLSWSPWAFGGWLQNYNSYRRTMNIKMDPGGSDFYIDNDFGQVGIGTQAMTDAFNKFPRSRPK